MDPVQPSMAELQEFAYGAERDYEHGSPHLAHSLLRAQIEARLSEVVRAVEHHSGHCNALEVGAGHGTFTRALIDAGASVTVTEMSAPSADLLRERYAADERVTVIYDPDGTQAAGLVAEHSLVVLISVLHHIPDYLHSVESLVEGLPEGGAFFCAQDPTWYPRRSKIVNSADRGAYLLWRLAQGDYLRGIRTRLRRVRGRYDEASPSDMVEYHVVRQGVDEVAIAEMLQSKFSTVDVWKYWSTQSSVLQKAGDRLNLTSTFGITATGRSTTLRQEA